MAGTDREDDVSIGPPEYSFGTALEAYDDMWRHALHYDTEYGLALPAAWEGAVLSAEITLADESEELYLDDATFVLREVVWVFLKGGTDRGLGSSLRSRVFWGAFAISVGSGAALTGCGGGATEVDLGGSAAGGARPAGEWPNPGEWVDCSDVTREIDEPERHLPSLFTKGEFVGVEPGTDVVSGREPNSEAGGYVGTSEGQLATDDVARTGLGRIIDPDGVEEQIVIERSVLDRAQVELDLGASLRLHVVRSEYGIGPIGISLTLRPDGSVHYLQGECPGTELHTWLDAMVTAGVAESQVDALTLVTDAEDPAKAFEAHAQYQAPLPTTTVAPAWADTPPEDRQWTSAPPAEREAVVEPMLSLKVPESWVGSDHLLCTRTPKAWSRCVRLSKPYMADGFHDRLRFTVEPGQPVEFWLVRGESPWEGIVRIAGWVPDPPAEDVAIELVASAPPDPALKPDDAVVRDAEQGVDVCLAGRVDCG